ncbi:hypothetical protein MNBD_PLANCTO02-803 [hydrothermal vent metagenome]|uniref:Uncharacterized protein n=1 Tax=hydrothermal vent metagenome TaxID=652676 RepID=A0A3B1E5G1_9ZZZZ
MNCNEFEQQLDTHIGKRPLGAIAELAGHASQCRQCLESWNGALRLEESLSQWNRGIPEIDIVESVISQIKRDLHQASPDIVKTSQPNLFLSRQSMCKNEEATFSEKSSVLAVVTVVLMLATGLFLFPSSSSRLVEGPSVVMEKTSDISENNSTSPGIKSFAKDAGVAYFSLAQHAVDVFADASLFVPDSSEIQIPNLLQTKDIPLPLNGLMEAIESDIKPIQSDFRKAIDFLLISTPDQAS